MEQKNEQPAQQELTPEMALNTLYSAARRLPVSADDHDALRNCALKLRDALDQLKQLTGTVKKAIKMPKVVEEPTENDL